MKKWLLILGFAFSAQVSAKLPIAQVVIWGHKLHSHTHSYIHWAFARTFEHMGYRTLWLDHNDDISGIDFANTLFLTEGQVDESIPLRFDSWYILHNIEYTKYKALLDAKRAIRLQVYTNDVLTRRVEKIAPCIYKDQDQQTLYMPWATDLLPHEIDEVKRNLSLLREKVVYWVGTIGSGQFGNIDEIERFKKACGERGVVFEHRSSQSLEQNMELTRKSFIAPALQGPWQLEVGYIPCRIFKAISYGQMGVTNSKTVSDLFEGRIVYNPDAYQLFHEAEKRVSSMSREELLSLMDFVRDNHTYINRINVLLEFLESVTLGPIREDL